MTVRRCVTGALLCALPLAIPMACSSDSRESRSSGFSVAESLRQIPASVRNDTVLVNAADLDAATKAGGADRPPAGTTDPDRVLPWLQAIVGQVQEGDAVVSVLLPEAAQYTSSAQMDEFRAELGWSLTDVSSFVEYAVPPNVFTVMTGDFDDKALDRALGSPTDGVWAIGGDDNSVNVAEVSPARPLGEALRLSLDGRHLAVARATPPVAAWRSGKEPSLADDAPLKAVADALDDAGVYSAQLAEMDFTQPTEGLSDEAIAAGMGGIGPFRAMGIGLAVADNAPVATFVYAFDDEQAAKDAVPVLTALFTDGVSAQTVRPWSELFSVQDISAKGTALVAKVSLLDVPVNVAWRILVTRDNLTAATPD